MVKVFLATEPGLWLPSEVLKSSIQRRTKVPVEFVETRFFSQNSDLPRRRGQTLDRFWIPEQVNYQENVLYIEPTSLILGDIDELLSLPTDKGALAHSLGSTYNTSVLRLNTPKLTHWQSERWIPLLKHQPAFYHELIWAGPNAPHHNDFAPLPETWFQVDQNPPDTRLIHFQDPFRYPWIVDTHPLYSLYIEEARAANLPSEALTREATWGHISQSFIDILGK